MTDWCFSLFVWVVLLSACTRCGQLLLRDLGPRWLPLAFGLLAILPVQGLPLGRWLHGYNANFSLPFVAILTCFVLQPLLKRRLLDKQALQSAYLFGSVVGLLLYPLALGVGSFDPYALGWSWPGVVLPIALVAAGLLWFENRFGLVLLVSGVAWQIGCLESDNAWDYAIDPAYFIFSVIALPLSCLPRSTKLSAGRPNESASSSAITAGDSRPIQGDDVVGSVSQLG
jgi:hypothetical protein